MHSFFSKGVYPFGFSKLWLRVWGFKVNAPDRMRTWGLGVRRNPRIARNPARGAPPCVPNTPTRSGDFKTHRAPARRLGGRAIPPAPHADPP